MEQLGWISRGLSGRGDVAFNRALTVEDEPGKQFLLTLIEELEPGPLRKLGVVSAGSDSTKTGILKTMPRTQRRLTLVGVYDGNLREKIAAERALRWPITFLPRIVAPGRLLSAVVGSQANIVQALATGPQNDEDEIRVALDVADGKDHLDYIRVLAQAVGLDISAIRRDFVRLSLGSEPENETLGNSLISEIRNSVNTNSGQDRTAHASVSSHVPSTQRLFASFDTSDHIDGKSAILRCGHSLISEGRV